MGWNLQNNREKSFISEYNPKSLEKPMRNLMVSSVCHVNVTIRLLAHTHTHTHKLSIVTLHRVLTIPCRYTAKKRSTSAILSVTLPGA